MLEGQQSRANQGQNDLGHRPRHRRGVDVCYLCLFYAPVLLQAIAVLMLVPLNKAMAPAHVPPT